MLQDNFFDGGVVHIIDRVLTLPASVSDTATSAGLTALVGALTAADLVETVNTTPDVTIFAPANAAFAAIGSAIGDLTTEQLTTILGFHVVSGSVLFSPDLMIIPRNLPTLAGTNVSVTNSGTAGAEDVFVNGAKVIATDFLVANGVVHVIDAVLNPENPDAGPGVQFEGASSAPIGALTSAVPAPSASYPALTSAFAGSSSVATSASSSGPVQATGAAPVQTAMVRLGALFGGAAVIANL